MEGDDRTTCLDSVAKERFVQELPKEGQAYVCQWKPGSLLEATRLAEEYFQYHEENYTSWSSRSGDSGSDQQRPPRKDRYSYYKGKRSGSPRYARRERSPREEETQPRETKPDNKPASVEQPRQKEPQQKPKRDPKSGKCFCCREPGHRQAECKLKVNRIEAISSRRLHESLRPGKIGDKEVDNILLDSKAEVSLIKQSLLPSEWKKSGDLAFATASGHILRRPKTTVEVDLGTRQFKLECGVVEDPIIFVPLLIGQNVPGVQLLHLMMETTPDNQQLD